MSHQHAGATHLAGIVVALCCLGVAGASAQRALPPASVMSLDGWEFVSDAAVPIAEVCHLRPGGVLAVDGKPIGYIETTRSFSDYRMHAEWRWPGATGNSGLLLHIGPRPKDRPWPPSLQVQLKFNAVGDLLPMSGAAFAELLSTPPDAKTPQLNRAAADSEHPAGEWNSCDIVCRGDTIEVSINGVVQNRVTGSSRREGPVGFQFEGTPFELRNVSVRPLAR